MSAEMKAFRLSAGMGFALTMGAMSESAVVTVCLRRGIEIASLLREHSREHTDRQANQEEPMPGRMLQNRSRDHRAENRPG